MTQEQHWTGESADAFAHRIAFDFIAQVEKRMEAVKMSQAALAQKLGISEGAVSHVLNNPQNLTLKTIAKYSRALGLKAAVVAYDDGDHENENGPVNSEVFRICWERAGRPPDFWAIESCQTQQAATQSLVFANSSIHSFYYGNEIRLQAAQDHRTFILPSGYSSMLQGSWQATTVILKMPALSSPLFPDKVSSRGGRANA